MAHCTALWLFKPGRIHSKRLKPFVIFNKVRQEKCAYNTGNTRYQQIPANALIRIIECKSNYNQDNEHNNAYNNSNRGLNDILIYIFR